MVLVNATLRIVSASSLAGCGGRDNKAKEEAKERNPHRPTYPIHGSHGPGVYQHQDDGEHSPRTPCCIVRVFKASEPFVTDGGDLFR